MESTIQNNAFVELDYTGRIKDSQAVFDTTSEAVARQNGINDQTAKYGSVIVCIGEGHLLKGLEKELIGKSVGKYSITVLPEDGFGKKNPKLLTLISAAKFREQNINPVPGLHVNVDGMFGLVKTVAGGRIVVDFNHPLSGKELDYELEAKRIVSSPNEKLDAFLKFYFKEFSATISEGKATIELKSELPSQLKDKLKLDILRVIPEIKDAEFKAKSA